MLPARIDLLLPDWVTDVVDPARTFPADGKFTGPQRALYIPGVLLKDENEIIVLELEGCEKAEVEITAEPDLG